MNLSVKTGTSFPCGVVMITRNRRTHVLESLQHLTTLPEKPPIVLVDNDSSDATVPAVSERFPEVRIVQLNENRGAAARNLGVRILQTPYIAFSDDDSWWAPGALAEAARTFEEYPRLGLIAAKVLLGQAERIDPVCLQLERSTIPYPDRLPGPFALGFVACGSIVRRDAYLQSGGYHRRFGVGGEEALLGLDLASLGWGLAYVSHITAHHYPSPLRDRGLRKQILTRNQLWVNWLRRPAPVALQQTARIFRSSVSDRNALHGVLQAIKGLPWAIQERRPVPEWLEDSLARQTEKELPAKSDHRAAA